MRNRIIYFSLFVLSAVFVYVVAQLDFFEGSTRSGEEEVAKRLDVLRGKELVEADRRTLQSEVGSSNQSVDRYLNVQENSSLSQGDNEPIEKSVIRKLEGLYSTPNQYQEFQTQIEEAFLDGKYDQKALLEAALHSREPLIQDIARSVSFAESVDTKGFEGALNDFEENLFTNQERDAVLDFLVSEVAPQDRELTLQWLGNQDESLWQEALPAIVAEWVDEDRERLAEWIFDREDGELRDRALAEYIAATVIGGAEEFETRETQLSLIENIASEEIRQEVRIRTGVVNFSRTESFSP